MLSSIIKTVVFIAAFNAIEHFAHEQTDGFSLRRVQFHSPLQSGKTEYLPELNQPFHYLGCGNQCYAFVSEDGQYVLKLFKYASSPVPFAMTQIPLLNHFKPFKPNRYAKVLWKRERDFRGYELASNRFKEETGILTTHLTPTDHAYPTITLYDKLHCRLTLNLNEAPFVLQKRATPVYSQIQAWISAGKIDVAKEALHNLKLLLKKRISLGLLDDDVHFYSNFGFVGTTPIQVDPGHFTVGITPDPDLEIATKSRELTTWCQKNAPELL